MVTPGASFLRRWIRAGSARTPRNPWCRARSGASTGAARTRPPPRVAAPAAAAPAAPQMQALGPGVGNIPGACAPAAGRRKARNRPREWLMAGWLIKSDSAARVTLPCVIRASKASSRLRSSWCSFWGIIRRVYGTINPIHFDGWARNFLHCDPLLFFRVPRQIGGPQSMQGALR